MRAATALILVCACSHREALRPRPSSLSHQASCRGGEHNELVVTAPKYPEAPVVVLEEIHLHGVQPPQPTLTIWRDGHVVFTREHVNGGAVTFDHLEGSISPAKVNEIVREVADTVATLPRHSSTYVNYIASGGQLTTIAVRDGDRWLASSVYGAHTDDFEAAAEGATAPHATGIADLEIVPPPRAFAQVYVRLRASRPTEGTPFAPYDYEVVLFGPDAYSLRHYPETISWPSDVPSPPRDVTPEKCDPNESDGCRYAVDVRYRAAIERFEQAVHAGDAIRGVLVNGNRFYVRFDGLYRGERTIDAVLSCARQLSGGE